MYGDVMSLIQTVLIYLILSTAAFATNERLFFSIIGTHGNKPSSFYSLDGGNEWKYSSEPPNYGELESIVCSNTGKSCIALGIDHPPAYKRIAVGFYSRDGGKSWKASQDFPDTESLLDINSLACDAAALHCIALANAFDTNLIVAFTTSNGGETWNKILTPPANIANALINSVACDKSGTHCEAIGNSEYSAFTYSSDDGGKNWMLSNEFTGSYEKQIHLNKLAAGEKDAFVVIGSLKNKYEENPIGFISTDGGKHWKISQIQTSPDKYKAHTLLTDISCSTDNRCVAVGEDYSNSSISYISNDGGETWRFSKKFPPSSLPDSGLISVKCSNDMKRCVSISLYQVYYSIDGGDTWELSYYLPNFNPNAVG